MVRRKLSQRSNRRRSTTYEKRFKLRWVVLFLSALFLSVHFSSADDSKKPSPPQPVKPANPPVQKNRVSRTISIIGVGDIMLGTNFPKNDLPADDGKHLLANVNAILNDADVTFGNLEGSILNSGNTIKNCSKCYAFRMPEKLADNLVTAGFDVMSVANNHVRDFGDSGLKNTTKVLDNLGIHSAGLLTRPTAIFEKNGVKYGFAAFAPNIGTVSIKDIPNAKKIVQSLAKKSDIVIVSFHGGAEGKDHQHIPKKVEYYYGENRGDVHEFAHTVIDAGADVVFGHGPHVTRAVELYKGRFIAYSLGNFCTYGPFNVNGVNGVAPIIKVNMNEKGEFLNGRITAIRQIKRSHVALDRNNKAIHIIRELTQADFPNAEITISVDGKITKK